MTNSEAHGTEPTTPQLPGIADATRQRLEGLRQAYDSGLISAAVYDDQQKAILNADPLRTPLTHLEQHKMLRDEIMQNTRTMESLQTAAAVAAAAIYTWLLLHRDQVSFRALWFVPLAIAFLCSVRYLDLTVRIWQIAKYLKAIEAMAFGETGELLGWEHHKATRRITVYDRMLAVIWLVAWALFLYLSFYLSARLSQPANMTHDHPSTAYHSSPAGPPSQAPPPARK